MAVGRINKQQIPDEFLDIFHQEGIKRLTDIQRKSYPYIFSKKNLVIVAPSGSGKTLIAELIALKDICKAREKGPSYSWGRDDTIAQRFLKQKGKRDQGTTAKTIFLVPLRALAEEKARHLSRIFREYEITTHMSMSEIDFDSEKITNCHILISTFERFRTIIGRMPALLHEVKNVVVDEFHLIGVKNRGPVLETVLTAIKEEVRLILLSATIANPEDIANWLEGTLISSSKRLVPLDFEIVPTLQPEREIKRIITQTIPYHAQILVFCGTRKRTEELAEEFAPTIFANIDPESFDLEEILESLEKNQLPKESLGNALIYRLVQKGTAFHHAGLSRKAQKVIESLFKRKLIKVLFCTETLGAGVNLPAREVIILNVKRWNNEWLSRNVFHQIAGRAGRPRYDTRGRCTIFSSDWQEQQAIRNRYWLVGTEEETKVLSELPPKFDIIESFVTSFNEIEKMVLSLIHARHPTIEELVLLLGRSYLNFTSECFVNPNQKYRERRNSHNGLTRLPLNDFFKLLLEPISKFTTQHHQILEKLFPTNDINLFKGFAGKNVQSFKVKEEGEEFIVSITAGKFTCSCSNDLFFCKHRWLVLKQLPTAYARKIINSNFAILQELRINNYIAEDTNQRLHTTVKGAICAEMGVGITKFKELKNWLIFRLFPEEPSLTQLLYECISVARQRENQVINEFENNLREPIFEHIILGKKLPEVIAKYNLYEGDFLRLEAKIKSLLEGLIPLSGFLGLTKINENFIALNEILSEVIQRSF
ncbi:MAG: DEAD/DEAH box helicase [Candidatus Heimdallarchaeota archaeon]|nr:DEAD/DEAH box helicase [Candidatus Heimdallarchaeota archaeon]